MIKEDILKQIAKRAGIDAEKFLSAIKSEDEQDLKVDGDGEFITDDELDNIKSESKKTGYSEGKIAGEEMTIKTVKKLAGVDFEGKTPENLFTAIKTKFTDEAGREPNEKIKELEADKKSLQGTIEEKETEIAGLNSQINSLFVETNVKSKLPDKLENGMTRDDLFILYSAKRKFKKTETGIELLDAKTNEVIKDKKLNSIPVEKDIEAFIEPYGKIVGGGRGKGDEGGNKNGIESLKNMTQVQEYCEKNSIPLSQQAGILDKASKNEGFDINA